MRRCRFAALSAAIFLGAAFSPAALAGTTQLPFTALGEVVVDPTNAHVFVSGGATASSVVVLDYDGNLVATLTGQQGATGMALDESTGTLYVALRNASAISKIDTTALTETSRFATTGMSAPARVALAGGRLWFSYGCNNSGGVGSAALDGTDLQTELGSASSCNRFATSPADADALAASDVGGSSVSVYDVSSGSPVLSSSSFSPGGAANIKHLVFAPDGADLLIASGSPYAVQSFSVADFTLSGSYATGPYPVAAAISADGAYVAGGADAYYNADVFTFDESTGDEIRRWNFGEGYVLLDGGLAFSPDASRLFAITDNPATGKIDFRVLGAPTVPAAPTTLTLTASRTTVTYGRSARLTAHLIGAGGLVSFYGTPYAGGKTLLGTVAVDGSGIASLTVRPTRKTWYTAEYAGDDTHAGSSSAEVIVRVQARTSVVLSGHYARSGRYKLYHLGRNPRARGTVAPKHVGSALKFVAQRYRSGGWGTVATATLTIQSDGSAYGVLRNTRLGRYRIRTIFGGDSDHLGSKSSWAYLRITY
jgi:hypothetical protein